MKPIFHSIAVGSVAFMLALAWPAGIRGQATKSKSAIVQKTFATPQEAADALIQAAQANDIPLLTQILGLDSTDVSPASAPERSDAAAFAALAREKKSVAMDTQSKNRAMLVVGNQDWPFPVPMVQKGAKWIFDPVAGKQEIRFRQIGANELNAIDLCHGYVEAQIEYALDLHDGATVHQYAQKLISSPGKHDGLYWVNPDGSPGGPVSEAVAKAIQEGFKPGAGKGYHGYFYRVLLGQGPAAPVGQMDFVINGNMIGGFALIASPVEYGVTGVKTFMVSHDGIVYEKDLGPDTLKLAQAITRYNPDKTWQRTDDEWPADDN